MAEGESDLPQCFVRRVLAGNAEEIGGAVGIILVGQIEGAVRPFRLVEELGLRQAALERGENGAEIGQAPFHGDFIFPVELLVAGLVRCIDKQCALGLVQAEADDAAGAARVGFINRVFCGSFGGGGGIEGGVLHGISCLNSL